MCNKTCRTSGDFEQGAVSAESRKGFLSMLMVMLGFTFFSASMWAGSTLGAGMDFTGFLWAVMAGNLILGAYCGALAFIAARTGNSIHILCRYSFGTKGSYLPSFLLGITQVGWFGVGVAMFSIPVQKWLESMGHAWASSSASLWYITLVAGLLMTSTAYFGIKSLTVLSYVAVPAIIVLGLYSSIRALTTGFPVEGTDTVRTGWEVISSFRPAPEVAIGAAAAIAISVGSFISGGSCTPDFVRFAKTRAIAVSTTAIAFFIGNSIMFIFGAIGGMFYQTNDISNVLVAQGLLIPGIIVLGFNIWTTNDNALYTSGLGLANITGLPKRYLVLANGVIGTLLAVWLYNNFCGWLSLLNTFLPSIGAIIAADFFIVRRFKADPEQAPANGIPAIIAWLAGTATANFIHWGITAINGMIIAAVVYTLLAIAFAPKKQA